jgi:hypothetical protein
MRVVHAGPDALAWDGAHLIAAGFGAHWRHDGHDWVQQDPRPLHGVGGLPGVEVDLAGGFFYATTPHGVRAVGTHSGACWIHPSGAVATGDDWVTHVGAPGRTVWPLVHALLPDSLRFSTDGSILFGIDERGRGRAVRLREREERQTPGVPLAQGVTLLGGRLQVHGKPTLPLAEASPAASGSFVAGPGGCVWDLRDERPVSEAGTILLGATTATSKGFATMHWESHEGWTTTFDGEVVERFSAPLPPDDTALALVDTPSGLVVVSAEGRMLDVHTGAHVQVVEPAPLGHAAGPSGPIPRALAIEHSGRRYVATESGWLLSLTSSTS